MDDSPQKATPEQISELIKKYEKTNFNRHTRRAMAALEKKAAKHPVKERRMKDGSKSDPEAV